jgi:hypothetical protein
LRECWLACELLRVSEARSNDHAEFLTARVCATKLPNDPGGADGIAEDTEEISGQPVVSVKARARFLASTALRFLPLHGTGRREAIVVAYNPSARKSTAKVLVLYSRLLTKFPDGALVASSRGGLEKMFCRGWM